MMVLVLLATVLWGADTPRLRLGDAARPLVYSVELTLNPNHETFSGVADIDLELRQPQDTLWLNALELEVSEATLNGKPAKSVPGDSQTVGLSTGQTLGAGRLRAHITYTGKVNRKSSAGVFALQEDNRWYVYTQFEPTDARRAFPCFDEPSWKTPWQIALRVPRDAMAVANTPQSTETDGGNGMKLVRFATSRPLPSYLVAFAVGPFEAVDLGKSGRKNTPMRVIVPHGKKDEAKFAAEIVPQLLTRLESFFGSPFPYAKLDSIVMPISNFAMENAGLITYGESELLSKPANDTIRRQRECAIVAAHEMAHQWFGDLVTTAWWNDIWLNEAFATWMEGKIVGEWKPEWHMETTAVSERLGAMSTDSLMAARQVRQPIASYNDIANAFDGITYEKGAAVIRMFENWIGPEKFRAGVQLYLKENADRSATASEFLSAVGKAAGKDVAPAFSSFLDQAGVPVVKMDLRCEGKPELAISQKRYLPAGDKGSTVQKWQIPFCFRYEADGRVSRQCELFTDPRATVSLTDAKSCPAWVMGNSAADGYYRTAYEPGTLRRLVASGTGQLTVPEKIGLLGDIQALVTSGDIPAAEALAMVPKFAGEPEREVVAQTRSIAALAVSGAVPDDLLEKGRKFIRDVYGERAIRLGWKAGAEESDDTRLLRQDLVPFVAAEGHSQPLIEGARELANAWLKDHNAVQPDMTASVLQVAAQFGDRAFFDSLVAALDKEKNPRVRQRIFAALGSFENPDLARAGMQLFLTGDFDAREAFYPLLFGPLRNRATRTLPFEFLKQNLTAIEAKIPHEVGADFAAALPALGGGGCDASSKAQVQQFFQDRIKNYNGGPRRLAQTLDAIDLCINVRATAGPSIADFLRRY
jgi:alanyl aminopeptidase